MVHASSFHERIKTGPVAELRGTGTVYSDRDFVLTPTAPTASVAVSIGVASSYRPWDGAAWDADFGMGCSRWQFTIRLVNMVFVLQEKIDTIRQNKTFHTHTHDSFLAWFFRQ